MTEPYYTDGPVTIYHGDCIQVIRELADNSVDSVVTDPPYAISFMGRSWDNPAMLGQSGAIRPGQDESGITKRGYNHAAPPNQFQTWCQAWATEAHRVLKPGGHLLAFGGSRTFHRLAAGIEDAGFEIRDSIAWMYGSGFPKSLDVSKAIDRAAGAERPVVGERRQRGMPATTAAAFNTSASPSEVLTTPATPDAERWQGWGTALKPAFEPIVVARKPLAGTVATNVLTYGTGALHIDANRIAVPDPEAYAAKGASVVGLGSNRNGAAYGEWKGVREDSTSELGRWPANVVLDGSQAAALDAQSGERPPGRPQRRLTPSDKFGGTPYGSGLAQQIETEPGRGYTDTGGASRFFYTAKADTFERPNVDGVSHPTVKPLDLMRWLVRLVTPKGGTVLEPFAGSGTTVEACVLEGFDCIAIEREESYLPLIEKRIRKPHHVGFDFDWDGVA